MADHPSREGPPSPVEARQQEQQPQQQPHDSSQVHSPTAALPNSQYPPGQQRYYRQQYQGPRNLQHQYGPITPQQFLRSQGPVHGHRGPYDMSPMAQSLPHVDYQPKYRYATGSRGGSRGYHQGPMVAPGGPGQPGYPGSSFSANTGAHPPMQQFYLPAQPPMVSQQYYAGPPPELYSPGPPPPPLSTRPGNYAYYANQPAAPNYYHPQSAQYTSQGASRAARVPENYPSPAHIAQRPPQPTAFPGGSQPEGTDHSQSPLPLSSQGQSQTQPTSVVRGPPRKPKQSGHAVWIGNLPPQTDLMSLVHHVCQQTTGLESLFLIQKSNCAFANYPDEEKCLEAQQKLTDSWYMSVRLVSRLRKNAVEGAQGTAAPTGPAALTAGQPRQSQAARDKTTDPASDKSDMATPGESARPKNSGSQASVIVDGSGNATSKARPSEGTDWVSSSGSDSPARSEKYFILKSLTVEDLERSVRTGIWATQSHNEKTLNEAFKTHDSVYLIFSANKSGEYFGYARMTSEINQDPAAAIQFAPTAQTVNDADLPKAIPTEATETTPRGRIIDDSTRGTIFWEIQRDDTDNPPQDKPTEDKGTAEADNPAGGGDASSTAAGAEEEDGATGADTAEGPGGSGEPQTWGKPFQLEWLSTTRLPFHRTRGMRNPLNANREIKIARDGTDVDVAVGRKLVSLFHQAAAVGPSPGGGGRSVIQ